MRPGEVIADRFELERLAGTGGMSRVFRALDRHSGEPAAVKLIEPTGRQDRFRREALVLASLRHPAIVRYLAHGTTAGGLCYLAMEWLEGEDLMRRLGRGPLGVPQAVALTQRLGEALGEAHRRGFVHRDLKPSNIFLVGGAIERAKLIDFGIARAGAPTHAVTVPGAILGTPGYTAPEQVRSDPHIDPRADVFSLGCVLFESVTGRPAFIGEHPLSVLAKLLLEDVPPPSELVSGVPPALDELLARMLDKEPAGRPADGPAVAAELAAMPVASVSERRSPSGGPPPALTGSEQGVVSVVLLRRQPETAQDRQVTPPTLVAGSAEPEMPALLAVADSHGARLDRLTGGSLLFCLTATGDSRDLTARAARCAMAVRELLPGAVAAVATGTAQVEGRLPVGEVIERAVRLVTAQAGRPGVFIDERTAGLLPARFEVTDGPAGLELAGEREVEDQVRTLLGRPTPCVGRDRELRTLSAFVDETLLEHVPLAMLLTGEPGVGKSRLRYELVRSLRDRKDDEDRPVEVWTGRADPMRAGSPFGLMASALSGAMQLGHGAPADAQRAAVQAWVARHVPASESRRVAAFIGEMVGVAFDDATDVQLRSARQDPQLMGDQIRRAFTDLVAAECAAHPLVLILEDLQWGDLPSTELVDATLARLDEAPLLVVALGRPEVHELFPDLWEARGAHVIKVDRLRRRACERLVRAVLGEDAPDAEVDRLVERAGGNVLFLEELIRTSAEGGQEELPYTVLAVVQGRLERLAPEARRVLRAGSVFGQTFWRGGVVALLGGVGRADDTDGWLGMLADQELLTRRDISRFPGDVEYVFRHSLVRDAAYEMLTDDDRGLGHRLAGQWLAEHGERDPVALAEHHQKGGELAEAARGWAQAAAEGLEGNDLDAAIDRANRAETCGATGPLLGAVRLVAAEAHNWRGDLREAADSAASAIDLLEPGSGRWCAAVAHLALARQRLGDRDTMPALAEALLSVPEDRDPGEPLTLALLRTASALLHAGLPELSRQLKVAAEQRLEGTTHGPRARGFLHHLRSAEVMHAGDLAALLRELAEAIQCHEEAGNTRRLIQDLGNLGFAHMEVGSLAEAEKTLRRALTLAEQVGLGYYADSARHNLGLVLARSGALAEARAVEESAVESFGTRGDLRAEGTSRVYLSLILTQAGDLKDAEREATEAARLFEGAAPLHQPHALAALAAARLAAAEAGAALHAARDAAERLESLGSIPEGEALVRLVLAEALMANGDEEGARAAIGVAAARLRQRADRLTDPALRRSFLEEVPENQRTLALARDWAPG